MNNFGSNLKLKKICNNISLFFPAYNEESNIKKAVEQAENALKQIAIEFEIIIVNDGSEDNTRQVSEGICKIISTFI